MIALVRDNQAELEALCAKHHVARLELFGSASADGEFDAERKSDLDFLVRFADITPRQHTDAYFGLIKDLEHLFGREVDLLEMDVIRNPYLKRSIDASRVVLYAA